MERYADFRLISATNLNLEQLVRKGLMRKDFYYRINAVDLRLPSLRERREDIPILIDHSLSRQRLSRKNLPSEFLDRLCSYTWPGNVRELQNALSRWLTLQDTELGLNFPLEPPGGSQTDTFDEARPEPPLSFSPQRMDNYADFERASLLKALIGCDWRPEKVAEELSLSCSTVYRKMKKYCFLKR